MKLLCVIVLGVLLSACATSNYEVGTNFTALQIDSMKEEVTTKEDGKSSFGSPATISKSSDGTEVWLYQYIKTSSHAQSMVFAMKVQTSTESKTLKVTFKGDVVESYSYTESPNTTNVY